jgi:hypothetical protein
MDTNETSIAETVQERGKKGIYGSTLKLIAIFTMLIDHTAATILDRTMASRGINSLFGDHMTTIQYANIAMRLIGRIAFPIFCFLLVEGFIHTRNKWKYTLRLAIFALISEIPFNLAFQGKFFDMSYQNVFFTLTIGMLVMTGFWFVKEKLANKKWLAILAIGGIIAVSAAASYAIINLSAMITTYGLGYAVSLNRTVGIIIFSIIGLVAILVYLLTRRKSVEKANVRFADLLILVAGMVLATLLHTDYSAFGILTVAVVYGLRRSRVKAVLGACITLSVMSLVEITAFIALIPVALYNGQRGLKLRYVFYIFYPAHLLILYLICYFMGIA